MSNLKLLYLQIFSTDVLENLLKTINFSGYTGSIIVGK